MNGAIQAKFTGTSVKIVAAKSAGMGQMQVTLDPGTPGEWTGTVDLYKSTTQYKVSLDITELTSLDMGEHTLILKCLGVPSPGRTGTTVNIDALDITGWLTQAERPVLSEETDANLDYQGGWAPTTTTYASLGSLTSVASAGGAVSVKFNGRYLAWIAKKGPSSGKAMGGLRR